MSDLLIERDELGRATVTLHRPERRNAITLSLWRELADTFRSMAGESGVRSIVVTGHGGHFSGGADIAEFERERADATAGAAYSEAVSDCVRALMAMPQPTLAAIAGYCLGGGCALAMACDFRLAAVDAKFGIPAARLGIIYSAQDTRNLVALVGLAQARHILFSGERFDAERALAIGFIDRIAESGMLESALSFVGAIGRNAPLSIAGAKATLGIIVHGGQVTHTADLSAMQRQALDSSDYREGVLAFLQKREPQFHGR